MLRTRKCHNCPNTFKARKGYRRFCDACRIKRRNWYRKKKPKSSKTLYWRQYRANHRKQVNDYNREWMRQCRAALRTGLPKGSLVLASGQCRNCAYRLIGEEKCPRCGYQTK